MCDVGFTEAGETKYIPLRAAVLLGSASISYNAILYTATALACKLRQINIYLNSINWWPDFSGVHFIRLINIGLHEKQGKILNAMNYYTHFFRVEEELTTAENPCPSSFIPPIQSKTFNLGLLDFRLTTCSII